MSSHHVIRDGQEPPVYLADASAPAHPLLPELLEWSSVVICLDRAMPAMLQRGYKVDHILCYDSTPEEWRNVLDHTYPVRAHVLASQTAWHPAVDRILIESSADFLHIVCGEVPDLQVFESRRSVTVFTPDMKWTWHQSGRWRKWLTDQSDIVLTGEYGAIYGHYRKTTSGICIQGDGIIEISSLQGAWIGEHLNLSPL